MSKEHRFASPNYLEPENACKHFLLADKWRKAGAVVPALPWIACSECHKPAHVETLKQTFQDRSHEMDDPT